MQMDRQVQIRGDLIPDHCIVMVVHPQFEFGVGVDWTAQLQHLGETPLGSHVLGNPSYL